MPQLTGKQGRPWARPGGLPDASREPLGAPCKRPRLLLGATLTKKAGDAAQDHIAAGGEAHDTVKPLRGHFGAGAGGVTLVDDEAWKAAPGERDSLLLVPSWDASGPDRGAADTVRRLPALDPSRRPKSGAMCSAARRPPAAQAADALHASAWAGILLQRAPTCKRGVPGVLPVSWQSALLYRLCA